MLTFASKRLKITQENPWHAVVDFCAYKWRDVQSVSQTLEGYVQRYIFISSDSVYNNMVRKSSRPINEEMFNLE